MTCNSAMLSGCFSYLAIFSGHRSLIYMMRVTLLASTVYSRAFEFKMAATTKVPLIVNLFHIYSFELLLQLLIGCTCV